MSSWVVDMEKKLEDAELPAKVERCPKHSIFRVPPQFKAVDSSLYKPRTVSLGPFHHGDEDLKPMEVHKLRAVHRLLDRTNCKTNIAELFAAVEEVAQELEDAYMDLDGEWRGKENRGKFLQMMITDGCFLLEVMRAAEDLGKKPDERGDHIFSWQGMEHLKPFVQRDMLMVENQLPLRLLETIVAAGSGTSPNAALINSMVLRFLEGKYAPEGTNQLGLHPLDIYRTTLLKAAQKPLGNDGGTGDAKVMTPPAHHDIVSSRRIVPRSAWKLSRAGIWFVHKKTSYLDDIEVDDKGKLQMPILQLDDSTAYRFRNMMAFEAGHDDTGKDVTAYVRFTRDLLDSAEDVRLLTRKGILEHDLDSEAVRRLIRGLARDTSPPAVGTQLWRVRGDVEYGYRRDLYGRNRVRLFLYESWADLRSNHLRSPWTILALLTATLLLVADILQAVYTVKSYHGPDKGDTKMH
ncbi:putative UPF0481 protein At3g02645 [Triticum urartu]|uniref:putative UPF0481 protein At3g02645 n=1 Tax=Triticum urartu TaxID=4572 RepID=UPI00204400BC|nr:putative UPF0481 protein At3g02645 [Triticum urartu]